MNEQVVTTSRLGGKENPHVIQADSSGAELLGIRLVRLVEQLNDLKLILNTRLAQYQPHQPVDSAIVMTEPKAGYNHGIYFDNRFIELDEGFKLIDECKDAINRAEI